MRPWPPPAPGSTLREIHTRAGASGCSNKRPSLSLLLALGLPITSAAAPGRGARLALVTGLQLGARMAGMNAVGRQRQGARAARHGRLLAVKRTASRFEGGRS